MNKFILALDLGQAADSTAIAVIEEGAFTTADKGMRDLNLYLDGEVKLIRHWGLRHLEKIPLGTPYPVIVRQVGELLNADPLKGNCDFVLDGGGVGRPIVDMFREARLDTIPIATHGGRDTNRSPDGYYHVPKLDLVGSLQSFFGSGKIKIAPGLPTIDDFLHQMKNFVVKIKKNANASYEAMREEDHDDLVMAVAMAVWWAGMTRPDKVKRPPKPEVDLLRNGL